MAILAGLLSAIACLPSAALAQSTCERASAPAGGVPESTFDETVYEVVMQPAFVAYRDEGADAADAWLDELLEQWRAELGPDSVAVGRTLYEQGRVDLLQDRDEQAIAHFDEALAIYRANPNTPPAYEVLLLQDRASARLGLRDLDAAERDGRAAVELARTAYPITDRAQVNALQIFAASLNAIHRKAEAARYYRKALACAFQSEELDPTYAALVVTEMVADMTLEDGHAETSLMLIDEAIARLNAWDGDGLKYEAGLLAAKATTLGKMGREEDAVTTTRTAIAKMAEFNARPGAVEANAIIQQAIYRHNLGRSLYKLGRYREAQEQLDIMAATMDETLPDLHPVHIFTDRQRALNLIALGEVAEGERLLVERYEALAKVVSPTELRLIVWQADLGERALKAGRAEEALEYYRLATEGIEQRIAERRIDAVVSEQEWGSQRDVYLGFVEASAMVADAL